MYLKIAFSAIVEYCCVSYHGAPPRGAADNAPYPFSKFLFFYFFSALPSLGLFFASFFIVAVVHRCLFW